MLHIFCGELVRAIQTKHSHALEWRQVQSVGSSETFFEPLARQFATFVQPVEIAVSGWFCPKCTAIGSYPYMAGGSRMHYFIAEESIPCPESRVFLAGRPSDYQWCMARAHWSSLLAQKKWKGVTSLPVGTAISSRTKIPPTFDPIIR
jgi:hypothetical protein